MITNYRVIIAPSSEALDIEIMSMLKLGWVPCGGLAIGIPGALSAGIVKDTSRETRVNITDFENRLIFGQAMIKREE